MQACEIDSTIFKRPWPDGLIEIDQDNEIINLNPQTSYFLGWEVQELIGRQAIAINDQLAPSNKNKETPIIIFNDQDYITQEIEWLHKEQFKITVSYRVIPTNQGTKLLIFQTCDVLGYQVEELKKLSTFTEINPAPLLEVDSQGLILFSNPAMTDLMLTFGFNDEGVAKVLPENLADLVSECLTTQSEIDGVESNAFDEDDPQDHRYFLWHFHYLKDAQKEAVLLCGIDISYKKQMEQQQAIFQQTLEQEKAKARKEYLAKMVHELRSPLNAVVGYATLLKQKLSKVTEEKYISLFDRIIEGGNQLAEQISVTLESSRVESGKLQASIAEFEVNGVAHELADKLSIMAAKKNLSMSANIPQEQIRIKADIQHVRQVVINLLSNAIKYTPTGSVKLHVYELDDAEIGSSVGIAVEDTGSGISDDEKENVFELFRRQASHSSSDIEGDGLGLAICVEMMNLNNGRITLESEVGKGSIFTAIFPRAE